MNNEVINQAYDLKKLFERYQEAREYKMRWLALYKDLYFYVLPDRDAFNMMFNYIDVGKPVTNQIWDNTAMLAAYQRANDLHGLLMPKDRIWGKYVFDPHMHEKVDIQAAQPLLDQINERIFFYLNESNLSRIVGSSNLDLVGGTGVMWAESPRDKIPLYFRSIPAITLYSEYSNDDMVTNCWYGAKMSARAILEAFPDYNGNKAKDLLENLEEQYTVMYGQIQPEPFVNKYYLYAALEDDPYHKLWEKHSSYPQLIVYRDRVRPGETEGRGVGIDLLPTIKDLQRMVEYSRKNMAFKAEPPMFYDVGNFFNPYSIRQWAGAMIARPPGGRNPLEALQMPTYPDVLASIQHLQDVIRTGFQVDPLGEIDSPVKTATEISIRENRAQRTSATDISRLINELPRQVYEVAAHILNERGLLMRPQEKIPNFNPKQLKFAFQSPLYDLQNQANLNHLISNLQIKQQFFGQGAPMLTGNLPEINKFLTDNLNLPQKLFVGEAQLKQNLQAVAQSQQLQVQGAAPTTAAGKVSFPETPKEVI